LFLILFFNQMLGAKSFVVEGSVFCFLFLHSLSVNCATVRWKPWILTYIIAILLVLLSLGFISLPFRHMLDLRFLKVQMLFHIVAPLLTALPQLDCASEVVFWWQWFQSFELGWHRLDVYNLKCFFHVVGHRLVTFGATWLEKHVSILYANSTNSSWSSDGPSNCACSL
jgi:hypothetical protein